MGLFDRFRRVQATDAIGYNPGDFYGAWMLSLSEHERILGMTPGEMWRTQPYLRTVVTFLARNIAQLGLQTFQRRDEVDRVRLRDGGVVEAFRKPNWATTSYELIYGLVADLALYDTAYWLLSDDPNQRIVRLPVDWVTPRGGDAIEPSHYDVRVNDRGEVARIEAPQVLAFQGWSPASLYGGASPIHALKELLAEQVQAAKYREAVWRRGGKVGAVLSRPKDAPEWSDTAREQFKADWDSKFTGNGSRVGGTPLLEDGMTLNRVDFSAHEMEFIEGSRLALNTVASVYHVNPTMIGLLDNANYSNVREFRRMLYGDTLGPILAQLEDRINTFLVPLLDSRADVYTEFNIEEKLQGSFEEQTKALQSSVGRPWMTANEARALRNMPAIDGGDELTTPLNVTVGGQASPNDTAPPSTGNEAAGDPETKSAHLFSIKAKATEAQTGAVAKVLRRFLDRQGKSVLAALGASTSWWDGKRWTEELTDDLHEVAMQVTSHLGAAEAKALGYDGGYDPAQTVNYLKAVSRRYAENINTTTKGKLDSRLDQEGDTAEVFSEDAKDNRASGVAIGVTTFLAGFAAYEAASQIAASNELPVPQKVWVTGSNPRHTHSRMNGEAVPLHEPFSNGLQWPGDGADGAAEAANCNCSISIRMEDS
jgi:HK97 family phage portal protein